MLRELSLGALTLDRCPLSPRTLALVEHLRSGGSVPAIHAVRKVDGVWRVLDGRHRVVAYKLLGRKTILVRYGEGSRGS